MQLTWDKVGERLYETGVSNAVLYPQAANGSYPIGYAWNGMVSVTETPSGAEATPQYADNIKYLNLVSAEEVGGTIEAFTSPVEFDECDGSVSPVVGITVGQQTRKPFALCYRTLLGNDTEQTDHGYKLHIIYGALAAPSERAYTTVNDQPEAMTLSWEFTTTKVTAGAGLKPTALITIDSTQVDATALAALEDILYGTAGTDASLPTPATIIAMFEGTLTLVPVVTAPTYNSSTDTITIPVTTGVIYQIAGEPVTGDVVITQDTVVNAVPAAGYYFPEVTDTDWFFDWT